MSGERTDPGPDDLERAVATYPQLERLLRSPVERRGLLRLLAAGVALGGLAGCGDPGAPDGTIVPAVIAPPGIIPGVPNFYATASVLNGSAAGILVEHQMGRPIKIEGNPEHPSSLGATDAIARRCCSTSTIRTAPSASSATATRPTARPC